MCTQEGINLVVEFCLLQILIKGTSKGYTLDRRKITPEGRPETQERWTSRENIKHMGKATQISTI